MKRRVIGFSLIAVLFMLMSACFIEFSHAATTSGHKNSLGVVPYENNPLVYVAGSITDVSQIEDALNLRFQPLATYALYDQNILLCHDVQGGNLIRKFDGKKNPMVLTYERQAHRTVDGVGCHNLVRVDNLEAGRELQ